MQPNEAMKAMARRVVAGFYQGIRDHDYARWVLEGQKDDTSGVQIALAAIMETRAGLPDQERILDIMDEHLEAEYVGTYIEGRREAAAAIHAALSAAIGEDIGGGRAG